MENSGYEALIIGVNVFIFLIALSIAIFLMNSTMDMSEKANKIIKDENTTMLEVTEDKDRIITGEELIYYINNEDIMNKYELCFNSSVTPLINHINHAVAMGSLKTIMNNNYRIEYGGISGHKLRYIFYIVI